MQTQMMQKKMMMQTKQEEHVMDIPFGLLTDDMSGSIKGIMHCCTTMHLHRQCCNRKWYQMINLDRYGS